MATDDWPMAIGEEKTRDAIQALVGGDHRYNGIVTAGSSTFLYSDHAKATRAGYNFDGWDAKREAFFYTGMGSTGDQKFEAGNAAIRDHKERELALRLFVAVGNEGNSGVRVHRYVGQFELVGYKKRKAPGKDHVVRDVIVFSLRPAGGVITDVAQISTAEGVVAASKVEVVPLEGDSDAVLKADQAELALMASGPVERKEADLTGRFREYLEKTHGHEVRRYKITTPAGLLLTDLADMTDNVLYEAKGTAERVSVRLALGQVLDYGRYVENASLAILLPAAPAADLVELLESHNVGCVVELGPGTFTDMTGLGRCP